MRCKRMMFAVGIFALMLLLGSLISFSSPNRGPERIVIEAGRMGNVDFPHHEHQDELKDCGVCHKLFPKEPGIIVKMKREGKLEPKKVMGNCRGCHRERVNRGMSAGPTSCNRCHNRELKSGDR